MKKAEVIIIGGGHAGCEAAHACARMGVKTTLITLDATKIAMMSCNPAMGGLAKGQLIKEIDALGGLMGRITDQTAIQYRRLNESKGPAVRSSRAQCDKLKYARAMQNHLSEVPNLEILEGELSDLLVRDENGQRQIIGVLMADGSNILARAVVITSGTFLRAIMHTGTVQSSGGRLGEKASFGLSESLRKLGFQLRRLKTGTPPRLHRNSIPFQTLIEQKGDAIPLPFSFYQELSPFPFLPQISCWITHTNEKTHEIIRKNLTLSPMFSGQITGIGPRYCPSIEDKVHRFPDRDRHQIFLEPEGLDVDEIYVNGVSTSLPREVQDSFIRSIPGLHDAAFIRYGYAVEYDSVDARQLKRTLESKDISGLFFAGQVNGTSGYEEAGAQGIIAGINAACFIQGEAPFIVLRSDGYLGVMVDDLTTKGSDEPYRMFTSRAEFRLLLREDNADLRLSEKAWKLGLLSSEDFEKLSRKREDLKKTEHLLKGFYIKPSADSESYFKKKQLHPLKDRVSGFDLLKRPEISFQDLETLGWNSQNVPRGTLEQIEIQTKYAGYIQRDLEILQQIEKNELLTIPIDLQYEEVHGLSNEIRHNLRRFRPETLGQLSRLQGVTPAAVANVLIHLKIRERSHERAQKPA